MNALRTLFGIGISSAVVLATVGYGFSLALASTAKNVRLAHAFFLLAAVWSLGCMYRWLSEKQTSTRYLLAFLVGGGICVLALVAFSWVENNYAAIVASPAPLLASQTAPTSQVSSQSNATAPRPEKAAKIVDTIVARYKKKHNGKEPSPEWINQRLKEQGQVFQVASSTDPQPPPNPNGSQINIHGGMLYGGEAGIINKDSRGQVNLYGATVTGGRAGIENVPDQNKPNEQKPKPKPQ
jgi:hypothetical protein